MKIDKIKEIKLYLKYDGLYYYSWFSIIIIIVVVVVVFINNDN